MIAKNDDNKEQWQEWWRASPTGRFTYSLDSFYQSYGSEKNDVYLHYGDEIFFNISMVERMRDYGYQCIHEVIHLKAVWIPHHKRAEANWTWHLTKVLTELADATGCGILAMCNPFDLDFRSTDLEELKAAFKDSTNFYYLKDYKEPKFKQRENFKKAGFKNSRWGRIGDRARVKWRDQFVYVPEKMDDKLKLFFMSR